MPDLTKTLKLSIGLEPMTPSLPSAWSGGDESGGADDNGRNDVARMCAFADAHRSVVPSEFPTFLGRSRT